MRNIIVKELNQTYIEDLDIEIVERKGMIEIGRASCRERV